MRIDETFVPIIASCASAEQHNSSCALDKGRLPEV